MAREAADYLFEQLASGDRCVASAEAAAMDGGFQTGARRRNVRNRILRSPSNRSPTIPNERFLVIVDWMQRPSSCERRQRAEGPHRTPALAWVAEAAAHWLRGGIEQRGVVETSSADPRRGPARAASGDRRGRRLLKPTITRSANGLRVSRDTMCRRSKPARGSSSSLIESRREALRLDEFKPKVMSAFVRNRLINDVYLPLIGDNLAKQIGTAGARHADRPLGAAAAGFAARLWQDDADGICGQPARADVHEDQRPGARARRGLAGSQPKRPTLSAREEIEKLNLALEMGDNVMIYVDDIQHTQPRVSPEVHQPLRRPAEDRGRVAGQGHEPTTCAARKVAVVMAGNPYTESGDEVQDPGHARQPRRYL